VSGSVGKLKDVMVVFLLCAPRLRREESEAIGFRFFCTPFSRTHKTKHANKNIPNEPYVRMYHQ
jgi:hypothetical protein